MAAVVAARPTAAPQLDLSALDQFIQANNAEQFCHDVVNSVCGKNWSGLGPYSRTLPAKDLDVLFSSLSTLLRTISSLSSTPLPPASIDSKLSERAVLSDASRRLLTEVISSRRPELYLASLESVARISGAHLKDFDWKVSVAWSSSKVATIRAPMLMLTLGIVDANGDRKEVEIEMGMEQTESVIATLEKINNARIDIKS